MSNNKEKLKLIVLKSALELGQKVDNHLPIDAKTKE